MGGMRIYGIVLLPRRWRMFAKLVAFRVYRDSSFIFTIFHSQDGDVRLSIQFHADKLSSAHIYLRLVEGQSWEEVPQELLIDCCQLTKANSIEGKWDRIHLLDISSLIV